MIKGLLKRTVVDRVDARRTRWTLRTLDTIAGYATADPGRCDPERAPDPARLRITWVVPPFPAGSGGHATVFRMINHFAERGHPQRLLVFDPFGTATLAELARTLRLHYGGAEAELAQFSPAEVNEAADVVVATSWHTAYAVAGMTRVARKLYLVQDMEHLFHPAGSEGVMAEESYRFGYPAITAGEWLRREVAERYGGRAMKFDFAFDRSVYSDAGAPRPDRVVCYVRPTTPRRAFELALLALRDFQRRSPDTEVVVFGAERLPTMGGVRATNLGLLSPGELNEVYNGAVAGLVISTTNYSLVPLEMMASGLPVVDLATPNNFAVYGGAPDFISLAAPRPDAMGAALHALASDPERRRRQVEAGHAYVSALSWEDSCNRIEEIIREYLATPAGAAEVPREAR
jgi:glycosyltransferase involved in cell wall biosynthesis